MTTESQMWMYRVETSTAKLTHLVDEIRQTQFEVKLFMAYARDARLTPAEQRAKDAA